MSPQPIVAFSLLPSAGAVVLLSLTIAAASDNSALTLGFFVPRAQFWLSVKHNGALGCNPEVHRLGELGVHLDTFGVYHRCTHHGMREVVLARHLNFVQEAPLL